MLDVTLRLVLASALSLCLSAGATLLASRAADGAPGAAAAEQQRTETATVLPGLNQPREPLAPGPRQTVLIELQQDPGAVAYALVLERAPVRNAESRAAAASAGRQQIAAVAAEQQQVGAALARGPFNADELFRVQRAVNGIAATVDTATLPTLRALPGVKAVHVIEPEYPNNSSSVPFVGAPALWDNSVGVGFNVTGAGIRLGVIDTGIDYQHATFGGTGLLADYQANDRTVAPDAYFPTAKVVGGWDFSGDAYSGSGAPTPDADPMDCNGHGTHVAGTAAGLGVTSAGTTFTGPFGVATPFASLRIGPGTAPQASLYALRVFGCGGGTTLTVAAIDWAMDPNGDNDLSDRLDVLNMSLGSSFGTLAATSAIAADNAVRAGVIVVTAAGNSGDTYFIAGSPGSANRVISTAATVDEVQSGPAAAIVNAPGGIAGGYLANSAIFGPMLTSSGTTGNVVLALDGADGAGPLTTDACTPLTNAAAIAGNIALIDRGTCGFPDKVKNAQNAGAIAAIIANSSAGAFGNLGGTDATVTIPSVMITFNDGATFKANIPGLNVTLLNGADIVASYSSRGPRGGASRIMLKPDIAAPGHQIVSAQTGITCTGSAGSTGCQSPIAGGIRPDGQPLTLNGTSMATPHVAGIMALLRQLHPTWTVEELKALVMNSALHDVTMTRREPRVGPGRIGAGRVDATLAAQSAVVAFNADEAGLVSLTFEGEVEGVVSRQKTLRLVNHGTTPQTYDLGVDVVVDTPGVAYSTPGGSTVTVPANESVELIVQMDANASQMEHTRDRTVSATQVAPSSPASVAALGTQPRHWLSEEAAYLTLNQGGVTRLRVPLYSAPAPVARMTAADRIITGGAPTGSTAIPLTGTEVCTGTLGAGPTCNGSFPTDIVSLVTPFELQVTSPFDPTLGRPSADLQYAGIAYVPGSDQLVFGVSTWGQWKSMNETAFNIYIDCGTYNVGADFSADTCTGGPDGTYDLVLFNTNPGSSSLLFGTSGVSQQDSFMTAIFIVARTAVASPVSYVNGASSAVIDSRLFGNQVAFLAASRTDLKVDNAFRYKIETCPGTAVLCQSLNGFHLDEAAGPYFWNHLAQGLDFGGSLLQRDLNGGSIPVTWNTANMTTNGALGALLLHHHNAEGMAAETVLMDSGQSSDLSVTMTTSSTTPNVGDQVTLTLTVANHGPSPASGVQVLLELPSGFTYVSDDAGGTHDGGSGTWTLNVGALSATPVTVHVVVAANDSSPLTARAMVGSTSALDPNAVNNVSTIGVMAPPQADVQTSIVPGAGPVVAGQPATFTVSVTNTGGDAAYNLSTAVQIAGGNGVLVSGVPSVGVFNPVSGLWNIASLGVGQSATLAVTVTSTSGPLLTLLSHAASSATDPNLVNNDATGSVAIATRATTLTLAISPATANVDESVTATVTVTDVDALATPGNPAGTVTFTSPQADVALGTAACVLVPTPSSSNTSSCQLTLSSTVAGAKTVNATYPVSLVHSTATGSGGFTVDLRPTTTTATNATATTDAADQAVLLAATVSSDVTVNSGIVTFTLRDAGNTIIGVPVVSTPLTDGTASVSYTLPGGVTAQTLAIQAVFTDTTGQRFAASSDLTKTLTLSDPPITSRTYTLAEGATGSFFDTRILLANPNATEAPVRLAFAVPGGGTVTVDRTLTAMSRATIVVSEIAGLESATMSTTVTSTLGVPIVVERTMRWDATGYGAHTEKAEEGGSTTWYFAEGAQGYFSTFLLLANPQGAANTAHVSYFREGLPPLLRDYTVAPSSRRTIDLGDDAELVSRTFGLQVTFDQPAFAERATYFGTTPFWSGGHASAGAKALATEWLFAEGATGSFFSTFLLVANPNEDAANVTVTYLPAGGAPVTKVYPIAGGRRLTLNVAAEDPSLASGAIGARITSDRPVVAERAVYWPQPDWIEGHSSMGITTPSTKWGLSEGSVGGPGVDQTYVLLVNTGGAPADITATFLRAAGAPVIKTLTLAPNERRNIWVGGAGSDVPELVDEAFGTVIESTQPIAVERSVYSNVGGVVWAAGTNATATRLPDR